MKYYKYEDNEADYPNTGMTYIEADDGWQVRCVTLVGERYISSNVDLLLADAQEDYDNYLEGNSDDEMPQIIPITQEEFEQVWQQSLTQHQQAWEMAKALYPIGKAVHGYIRIFFPQGVIASLPNQVLAVADYAACKASTTPDHIMSSRNKITGVVSGYDELNHWLILSSPQVLLA